MWEWGTEHLRSWDNTEMLRAVDLRPEMHLRDKLKTKKRCDLVQLPLLLQEKQAGQDRLSELGNRHCSCQKVILAQYCMSHIPRYRLLVDVNDIKPRGSTNKAPVPRSATSVDAQQDSHDTWILSNGDNQKAPPQG